MLTRLKINGFKNLVDVDVRFGPFTCIAGANGVGKSNLFDAIRFLSHTANFSLLEAALRVRDEGGRNNDIKDLFHRVGDQVVNEISFDAEMIIPPEAVDDLGQIGKATVRLLRYVLKIRLRHGPIAGTQTNPLEIVQEELTHIKKSIAHEHLLFPHHAQTWRDEILTGRRSGVAFISTTDKEGARIIKLHQDSQDDKGGGRAYERAAGTLPRTVLSSSTAAESPTALGVRREMQSWRMLQLEPSALRQPDEFTASSHLDSNGRHLPANLNRLALRGDAARVYTEVANRLSELIGTVKRVRIDRDDKRETLTLMLTSKDGTELPARALSDGTLRFLAYTILELDPETPGVLCMEEPENGIHPDRIPAMVQLLQDIAVDPQEPPDETNPLRQVIVNTHSPSVVMAVPEESILLAKSAPALSGNDHYSKAVFACIPGNWRNKGRERIVEMTRGEMLGYLNPAAVILNQPNSPSRRRIIDSPHQSTFFDHLQVK